MATLRIVFFLLCGLRLAAAQQPRLAFPETQFDWRLVFAGEPAEHAFTIRNDGDAPVAIARVDLTPPLSIKSMPAVIPPRQQRSIVVHLDTGKLLGRFDGIAIVHFANSEIDDAQFTVAAKVVGRIEVAPLPAFFVAGQRGKVTEQSLDIINHESVPVVIHAVEHPANNFTTKLETIDPGWHYRLTLALNASGVTGRHTDLIILRTSSAQNPTVPIEANTILRSRVHTFPDAVDLGALRLSEIASNSALPRQAQVLMVYQDDGRDFRVKVRSSLDCVSVSAERGPAGDRYQILVSLTPDKLHLGAMSGEIVLTTSDPDFPELSIPVTGTILP
ncbi:MAG TPA: hypothetical protein VEK84_07815 [Terriglobales bacterium]|nr:hypothetical protein [Terriglobales bacterium]